MSRSLDQKNKTCVAPTNSATCATSLLHGANMRIRGLHLHVTLVDFTTVQMNEIEPTRSNPAVFPKIRNMEIANTAKTPRDVELENGIV